MTWVLTSLGVLAASGLVTLALARAPRLALGTAMLGVFVAALLLIVAAGSVLAGSSPIESQSVSWPLPLGTAHLALDGLSSWFLLTIGILAASVAVYSPAYLGSLAGREPIAAFGVQFCVLMASLILLVCAADAVLFLVGWEAMTLAAFSLVAFHHDRPEVRRGAWMYLVATHIGTALCILPLFAIFTASAGSTEFAAYGPAAGLFKRSTLIVLFVLGLLGFGTKAGLMPMHVWLPAAHPIAPTPVSALLSDQFGHEGEVHHRGLVHDKDVQPERVLAVVPEADRSRTPPEQSVDRGGCLGDGVPDGNLHGQVALGRADHLLHARGGLARGRREADLERAPAS